MEKSNNLEKFLNLVSEEKSGWLEKAQWRADNRDWLEHSGKIAIKILTKLRENRHINQYPSSQKDLAELMQISPQQVNKIVKGSENLTLETISRIEQALNIQILELELV